MSLTRRKAEVLACVKDLILRNIQAIESNFLMIDEDDEVALGFASKTARDEVLEVGLKRRIDQEIIKRDYYMERIARFKEWTETVLVNIDSIMRTMGRDVFPDNSVLGKQMDSERFGQPMTDSKKLSQHLRAESFNLGDSLGGDVFGYQSRAKKRGSELYSYERNPVNAFQGHEGQFKSSQRNHPDPSQMRRGYSKGAQPQSRGLKRDSFDL